MLEYILLRIKTVIVKMDDPSLAITQCCVYLFQKAKGRCEYNLCKSQVSMFLLPSTIYFLVQDKLTQFVTPRFIV